MQILLWLVPPVVVTLMAMAWVGWVGRERGEVDREEALRRLGAALERPLRSGPAKAVPHRRHRSTGVAVRRTPRAVARPETGEQRRAG